MISILKNSDICNVYKKTNCKDVVKVSEVAVRVSLNTKKYNQSFYNSHNITNEYFNVKIIYFTYNLL